LELAKQLDHLGTETAFAVSAAAAAWGEKGNRIYPFHLGDINLPTPANIVEAMQKAIGDGYTGYCPGAGIPELRDALARDVGTKRGLEYSAENVSVQPGGKPVIGKFLATVMNPGDEVLYPNPGYPIYESQIEYQGGIAIPYGYIETETGFNLDLEAIKILCVKILAEVGRKELRIGACERQNTCHFYAISVHFKPLYNDSLIRLR